MLPPVSDCLPGSPMDINLVQTWRREDCTPTTFWLAYYLLQRTLKLLNNLAITELVRKRLEDIPMPPKLRKKSQSFQCEKWAVAPEFPRKQTFAFPTVTTSSIVNVFDAQTHRIKNNTEDIMVTVHHRKTLWKLKPLPNGTALETFDAFSALPNSVSLASSQVYVNHRPCISAKVKMLNIHDVTSQLCLIQAETSWDTDLTERFHTYLQKSIHHLLFQRIRTPAMSTTFCWLLLLLAGLRLVVTATSSLISKN